MRISSEEFPPEYLDTFFRSHKKLCLKAAQKAELSAADTCLWFLPTQRLCKKSKTNCCPMPAFDGMESKN
uniref:Uncharacterized protein n=1 Tax=Arundo donax TaxID=35708 RepID=A0A0A9CSE5_ARUDO